MINLSLELHAGLAIKDIIMLLYIACFVFFVVEDFFLEEGMQTPNQHGMLNHIFTISIQQIPAEHHLYFENWLNAAWEIKHIQSRSFGGSWMDV